MSTRLSFLAAHAPSAGFARPWSSKRRWLRFRAGLWHERRRQIVPGAQAGAADDHELAIVPVACADNHAAGGRPVGAGASFGPATPRAICAMDWPPCSWRLRRCRSSPRPAWMPAPWRNSCVSAGPSRLGLPLRVGLERAAETIAAAERLVRPPVTRLALVVDQMEELFSADRVNEQQRTGFIKALAAAGTSGHVWIIGTMRSDFYPRCADLPELAALKAGAGQFDLLPPDGPYELAQMIGDPARAAGLRFEEKATGERLDHVLQETTLRDPQALPLLEFTLAELYKLCSRDEAPGEAVVLTFAAYDQLGGGRGRPTPGAAQRRNTPGCPANVQAALPHPVFRAPGDGAGRARMRRWWAKRAPVLSEVFAAYSGADTLVEAFIKKSVSFVLPAGPARSKKALMHLAPRGAACRAGRA